MGKFRFKKKSEHISKIIVHPRDPNTIWVAVQGPLWSPDGERGLYKSIDGGKTWKNKLKINKWTGVTDLVIDGSNPAILYAASWQRHRTVAAYMGGGPGTSLYKSTDYGDNWFKIDNGLPESNMGKIGLAISPMKSNVLYAAIEGDRRKGAVYKSTDSGASWTKMSNTVSGGTGPHYYQELVASPHQFDKIFLMNVRALVSEDGGKTFYEMKENNKHSDNHALVFKSKDPNYLLFGTDGGLYESFDNTKNWKFINNLPLTQFYKLALDDATPFYNIYGGTQDNNTQGGLRGHSNQMVFLIQTGMFYLGVTGTNPLLNLETLISFMHSGSKATYIALIKLLERQLILSLKPVWVKITNVTIGTLQFW